MNDMPLCNNLETYIDDQLTGDELVNFERHLKDCECCQREFRLIEQFDQDVAAAWRNVSLRNSEIPGGNLKTSILADKSLIGSSLSVHQLLAIALLLAVVIGVISWFYLPLDQFANSNREVPSRPKPDSLEHVDVQPNDSSVNQPYITTRHRARAEFDDDTIAVPLKSQHVFTVIQVIPKVTYLDGDK